MNSKQRRLLRHRYQKAVAYVDMLVLMRKADAGPSPSMHWACNRWFDYSDMEKTRLIRYYLRGQSQFIGVFDTSREVIRSLVQEHERK